MILYQLIMSPQGFNIANLFFVQKESYLSVSKKILEDFTAMIRDGLAIRAGREGEPHLLVTCKLLPMNSNYLMVGDRRISLAAMKSIDVIERDGDVNRDQVTLTFYGSDEKLFFEMQSLEECEALAGGLQVYCSSVRTRAMRKLARVLGASSSRDQPALSVQSAFFSWMKKQRDDS